MFAERFVNLTDQDRDYIARVVDTEVPPYLAETNPAAYREMVRGVVDTIINRVSSGQYPNTVAGVANQRNQFTAINGPRRANNNPAGSVQQASPALPATRRAVDDWLAAREGGMPSYVGGFQHYANPNYSDARHTRPGGWVNQMELDPRSRTFGVGDNIHVHGLVPGAVPHEAKVGRVDGVDKLQPFAPKSRDYNPQAVMDAFSNVVTRPDSPVETLPYSAPQMAAPANPDPGGFSFPVPMDRSYAEGALRSARTFSPDPLGEYEVASVNPVMTPPPAPLTYGPQNGRAAPPSPVDRVTRNVPSRSMPSLPSQQPPSLDNYIMGGGMPQPPSLDAGIMSGLPTVGQKLEYAKSNLPTFQPEEKQTPGVKDKISDKQKANPGLPIDYPDVRPMAPKMPSVPPPMFRPKDLSALPALPTRTIPSRPVFDLPPIQLQPPPAPRPQINPLTGFPPGGGEQTIMGLGWNGVPFNTATGLPFGFNPALERGGLTAGSRDSFGMLL